MNFDQNYYVFVLNLLNNILPQSAQMAPAEIGPARRVRLARRVPPAGSVVGAAERTKSGREVRRGRCRGARGAENRMKFILKFLKIGENRWRASLGLYI